MNYLFLVSIFFSLQIISQAVPWWKKIIAEGKNPWIEPVEITQYSKECVCVKPSLCSESGEVITDGFGIVQLKSGLTCKEGLVCCVPPTSSEEEPTREGCPDNPQPGDVIALSCYDSNIEPVETVDNPDVTQTPPQVTHSPYENQQEYSACGEGASEPELLEKVSGDNDETLTQLGDFPWMLLMNYEDNGKLVPIGGASLVHPRAALTAAHSLIGKDKDLITIRGAEYDLNDDSESHIQEVGVKKIIQHPLYRRKPPKNDIAVIILEQPFVLSLTVRTICLPPRNPPPVWNSCSATGWGSNAPGERTGSQKLRKAEMTLVPEPTCTDIYRKNGFTNKFRVDDSFLCAGSGTKADTCLGDGGGPLHCHTSDSQTYHLVGITAWGLSKGCGKIGIPGGYTNVANALDFIEETLANEEIKIKK